MRTSILETPTTVEAGLPYAVQAAAAAVVGEALNQILPTAESGQTGNPEEPGFQSITPANPNLPA